MHPHYPRLLGDIGGTHARWAWQEAPGAALGAPSVYLCAEHPSVLAVIEHHLAAHGLPRPARVAFGIATPVAGDAVAMTNHAWRFSIAELQTALGVERLLVLNDFAAIAASLPVLAGDDLRPVGNGLAVAGAPQVVLGPGTGLGVAGSVPTGEAGRAVVVPGEGGHVTLAATNAREEAVIAQLRLRFGHASAERAVSGPGLMHLCEALRAVDGASTTAAPGSVETPASVVERALSGSDATAVEALSLFAGFLGSVAGNLALSFGARGGVFLGGGIVPRLGAAFDALPFRERFEAKGRFRGYLVSIPTAVITSPTAALQGAAHALDGIGD